MSMTAAQARELVRQFNESQDGLKEAYATIEKAAKVGLSRAVLSFPLSESSIKLLTEAQFKVQFDSDGIGIIIAW